jgi:Bardet-Biedl syndrome 7 protein
MELTLTPNELYQVNSIRGRNTLCVLPKGKHKSNRLVVGDSSGVTTCLSVKRGSTKREWAHGEKKNSEDAGLPQISSMCLGGSKYDKIFISRMTNVEGITRKGKQFFEMNTNMTDNIANVAVKDTKLFVTGSYTYNVFDNQKEVAHVMTPAPIGSMCLAPSNTRSSGIRTLLGCSDRMVRVVHGDPSVSRIMEEVPLDGAVNSLCRCREGGEDEGAEAVNVVYGTDKGSFGLLVLPKSKSPLVAAVGGGERPRLGEKREKKDVGGDGEGKDAGGSPEGKTGGSSKENGDDGERDWGEGGMDNMVVASESTCRRGWSIGSAGQGSKRKASINALASFDITSDGVADVIVGRNDGMLEVYGFDMGGDRPKHQFEANVNESIRALGVGEVSNAGYNEIVASSFSGRVIGYTTESLQEKEAADKYGRTKGQVRREVQVSEMKNDIESLKKQVNTETKTLLKALEKGDKDKSQKGRKSIFGGGGKGGKSGGGSGDQASSYLFTSDFDVNHQFTLVPEEALYTLTIELPIPMESLVLHADVNVGVFSDPSSSAVVNVTPGKRLLASIRIPQDDGPQHRTQVKIRAVEGQHGTLSAFILARTGSENVDRSAMEIKIPIKPLSLHSRIHKLPEGRPMSHVKISGSFSMGQAHQWVLNALPEVPEMAQGESAYFIYESTFVGTVLTVNYTAGEVVMMSDNVSSLAILKETITKDANSRSLRISVSSKIQENVAEHVLKLIEPKLHKQFDLSSRFKLLGALEEITNGQSDYSYLQERYREILEKKQELAREVKESPKQLEALFGVITDLFIDKHMFDGRRLQHLLPDLTKLLQRYDENREQILHFIDTAGGQKQ